MNGYVCFYLRTRIEVYANTSYEARCKAAYFLGVPKKRQYMISVNLAEKNGEQVFTSTATL